VSTGSDAPAAGAVASAGGGALPSVAAAPPTGAGRAGSAGDGRGSAIGAYVAELRALVARAQRYPALARRRRIEGVVVVHLVIRSDGSIESADAAGGAVALLTRSALDAVERASPFPPPPTAPLHVELPIRWKIEG